MGTSLLSRPVLRTATTCKELTAGGVPELAPRRLRGAHLGNLFPTSIRWPHTGSAKPAAVGAFASETFAMLCKSGIPTPFPNCPRSNVYRRTAAHSHFGLRQFEKQREQSRCFAHARVRVRLLYPRLPASLRFSES